MLPNISWNPNNKLIFVASKKEKKQLETNREPNLFRNANSSIAKSMKINFLFASTQARSYEIGKESSASSLIFKSENQQLVN